MRSCVQRDSHGSRAKQRELLVLDPDNHLPDITQALSAYGWHCLSAQCAIDAGSLIEKHQLKIAVVMIATDGDPLTRTLSQLQQQFPQLRWLAISDGVLDQSFSWLLSVNVSDYFHLPMDWQRLSEALGHCLGMASLAANATTNIQLTVQLPPIRGEHPLLQSLRHSLEKLGNSDENVLLSGETGSGKGLCAKWLHRYSHRHSGPFVSLNCGALPPSLIQSTLFGHEKGAFTGAERRYIGHLEQADGGTLFLDEIADLPLDLQVNLLQFLDDKHIFRVGGAKPLPVDCRILFASHQDLESAVDEGRFREDLFHRINVLRLHVPCLREYLTDVMVLAGQFLDDFCSGRSPLAFADDAVQAMSHYSWPGNVRELQNRVRRAAIMADGPLIAAHHLGLDPAMLKRHNGHLAQKREELDTEVILRAISANNHNISAAARSLNISRTTFYRLIKKCNIRL